MKSCLTYSYEISDHTVLLPRHFHYFSPNTSRCNVTAWLQLSLLVAVLLKCRRWCALPAPLISQLVKTIEPGCSKWKIWILAEQQHTRCTGAFCYLERITGASSLRLKEKIKLQKPHTPEVNSPHVPANLISLCPCSVFSSIKTTTEQINSVPEYAATETCSQAPFTYQVLYKTKFYSET